MVTGARAHRGVGPAVLGVGRYERVAVDGEREALVEPAVVAAGVQAELRVPVELGLFARRVRAALEHLEVRQHHEERRLHSAQVDSYT